MPTPYVNGSPSIANRWLNGSASVLWIGDSIGGAFENRLLQVLRVSPAGFCARGAAYDGLNSSAWATLNNGGAALGTTALLTESNYSPLPTKEAVFNGSTIASGGSPAAIDMRLMSDTYQPLFIAGRTGLVFGGADWLTGGGQLNVRCVMYRNANSANGIIRNYVRGGNNSYVPKATGPFLNLHSVSPSYLADDIPFPPPAAGEDIILEAQSFNGATPTAGSNFVMCCALLTNGRPGFTYIPASVGGWDILKWTDPSVISDAALAGVLPLLGITDIVISLGQNNGSSQSGAQFQASLLQAVARLRTVLPNAAVVFLPTYDTNNSSSAPHLADFADAHYAAQLQTPNSCFLNLYKAAGVWPQLNALGMFTDTVHPSESGKVYFIQTIQSLLDLLLADFRTTAAGRYAKQQDIEDLFGRANVAAWAQLDSPGVLDTARVQRALDDADATIDDFFRGGPYASPLLLGASQLTVAAWAATFAGVRLYRSRTTNAAGGTSAVTASVSISAGASVSAAVSQPADPYTPMLAAVRAEMARCKAGAWRLDASPGVSANAPAVVV